MIKKTLYFGNPAYLSLRNGQLVIKFPEVENNPTLPEGMKRRLEVTIAVEDIGVVVLDNKRITLTSGAMAALIGNNCALIACDSRGMPVGLTLPLSGNTTQSERFRRQIDASLPLRKQLWQQTVQAKIGNQAAVLAECREGEEVRCMRVWASAVRSGDADNLEGRAAAYYWRRLFPDVEGFTRDRDGMPPNNLLNYGYAVLRAVVARALVASGLLPTLGIHHQGPLQCLLPGRRRDGALPAVCGPAGLRPVPGVRARGGIGPRSEGAPAFGARTGGADGG